MAVNANLPVSILLVIVPNVTMTTRMIVTFANFQGLVNDFSNLITCLNHSVLNLGTESQCVLNFPHILQSDDLSSLWTSFLILFLLITRYWSAIRVLPVSTFKKEKKKKKNTFHVHVCLLHCCFLKMSMQCFFFCYLMSFLNSFWIYFIYSPFSKTVPPPIFISFSLFN